MTYIDLSKNFLDAYIVIELSGAIKSTKSLRDIDLSYNNIGNKALYVLLDSISKLERISVKGCNFGDIGLKEIGKFLSKNRTLKRLHLSHNEIVGPHLTDLLSGLRANVTLLELDVSFTKLGVEGGKTIASALRSMQRGIMALNLSGCDLTNDGKSCEVSS